MEINSSNSNLVESLVDYKLSYEILSDILNREQQYNVLSQKQIDKLFLEISIGDISSFTKTTSYDYNNFNYYNDSGLTPMHYCIKCGDINFLHKLIEYGASIDICNKDSHNLLEYSCINEDPNFTDFLLKYNEDISKTICLRKFREYSNRNYNIDTTLVQIYIINYFVKEHKIKYIQWILDILPNNLKLYKNNEIISSHKFVSSLDNLLNVIKTDSRNSYLKIIKEELSYPLKINLGCPFDIMEILLYNIIPFICYEHNYTPDWLLNLEIKIILLKFIKDDILTYKNNLREYLIEKYINSKILNKQYLKLILLKWFNILEINDE